MWKNFVDWLVFQQMGLKADSALGQAVHFFIYDTVKIFVLLAVVIYLISYLRSYFPPERTKKYLSGSRLFGGNILAALLGIVTPFCSCSAVPMFIGFVEAGVPLGVTFSFLIASPMVNEVALALLFGLFGWKIAFTYLAAGLTVAIISGIVIGKLGLESWVQDYVYQIRVGQQEIKEMSQQERHQYALGYVKDIIRKVWLYILVAIAIGAWMHGYVPQDFLLRYAGPGHWYAVPLAVLVGIPLYSNAAGIIPLVSVFLEKGMALGTVLAFMMAVTALSLPEMIILKQVLKPRLIALFVAIVGSGILLVGYLFNWLW
ncbi:hypothetical protein SAMN02745885_02305 [Carboxydocella sporoproducens DSM 16521]|uniref:Permease n=2 Tax=Carboxydocella TaxID=178898 RepID=A0A1T4RX16_9FIRM|nr:MULTISPECIES: permease [Carboxydocella]AVX20262.1 hypothetical protein CFE_1067 [Carboxydocella thermautotrophica]AVX30683.1 hypothetical protein CTH_1086 [Carboxydocella thermautotrophica]SKA20288.1 hypothetical protein SAMN02745885_02305 [Carboxydocella sporoproducens DSM 16521]